VGKRRSVNIRADKYLKEIDEFGKKAILWLIKKLHLYDIVVVVAVLDVFLWSFRYYHYYFHSPALDEQFLPI
jgi:hypothetical protein